MIKLDCYFLKKYYLKFYYDYLVSVCACAHAQMCHGLHMRVRGPLEGAGSLLLPYECWDQTRVFWLDGTFLYLLSYLASAGSVTSKQRSSH